MNCIFKRTYKFIYILLLIITSINAVASDIYRTTSELKFRKAANAKSHSFGIIKKGVDVNVIDKSNDEWYKIEYNGKTGYLSSKYLQLIQEEKKAIVVPETKIESNNSSSGLIWFSIIGVLIGICFLIMKKRKRLAEELEIDERLSNQKNKEKIRKENEDKLSKQKINEEKEKLKEQLTNQILNSIKVTVTSSRDDSIIDVTGKSLNLHNTSTTKPIYNVPVWGHQYIYSYSEINSASQKQIDFYKKYRDAFYKGIYLDLEGNNNYAFILLFDLQNQYSDHKNLSKLENQLTTLGKHYPKTNSYGVSFLIEKMGEIGDIKGIERLKEQNKFSYQDNSIDYDTFNWRNQYKTKLNLNAEESEYLNKIWYWGNNFSNIEFCSIEILKLYIGTIKALKEKYIQEGTTIDDQFFKVSEVLAKKQFKYKEGSSNYKYCIETTTNDIYPLIFKYCENVVREHYGHKRKLSTDSNFIIAEAKLELESKLVSKITEIHSVLVSNISPPDLSTDIELYSQNTNRWKIKFEALTSSYKENPKQFVENIISLGELNKKNPSIENIFFEASKFISQYDKESALTLYVYYLYYDLKSATFDYKQLTKTIQKNLFKTNEQLHDFEKVVSELIKDKKLEKALQGVSKIYEVKRKKIKLDTASIKEVQQQHSGTVELLNEYLKDEYEDDNNSIKTQEINNEEVKIEITQKTNEPHNSIYLSNINLTEIHLTTLELFTKNSFSVLQSELETFSKSKGVFKNQLIESINEICYEILDDILIEEEDEFYTINPDYYQKLLVK
ncbi:MAG: SH3 domain-containing protein [Bacteroidetes bacterium]|nr:SH3 domain-containing protein [Bacteroidota bacterium]